MKCKVGQKVKIKSLDWYKENKDIHGDICFDNAIFVGGQSLYCGCELTIRFVAYDSYRVIENDYYWTGEMIEGLVEEETYDFLKTDKTNLPSLNDFMDMLNNELKAPDGYIFKDENGNVINATKIVLEKKKKEYPKTYEECCKVMNYCCNPVAAKTTYKEELIRKFQFLLLYRDTYWKIAGEEMGLGKPWEPDWGNPDHDSYPTITRCGGKIIRTTIYTHDCLLAFPTEEMRDAFYEVFKEEIEICKELL